MARNIFTVLDELASGIAELRQSLAPLAALSTAGGGAAGAGARGGRRGRRPGRPAAAAAQASAPAGGRKARAPRKGAVSPKRALQGKYMVALRRLSKADQNEVKKMRAEQGVEAALRLAASKVA